MSHVSILDYLDLSFTNIAFIQLIIVFFNLIPYNVKKGGNELKRIFFIMLLMFLVPAVAFAKEHKVPRRQREAA
jgi:Zn-dependent protease